MTRSTLLRPCALASLALACSQQARSETTAPVVELKVAEKQPPPLAAQPAGPTAVAAPNSAPGTLWSFDADRALAPPSGFSFGLTGSGARGRFEVKADASAPSGGQVLAQLDTDATDNRFPIAVADAVQPADVRVSVKCKMVSGQVDQACGLVVRYQDENNYYITRANALEGNVRLYYVKAGKRKQIASFGGEVKAGTWYDYAVEVRGNRIQVFWNGKGIIDQRDGTFTQGGRVGVWTKADSVTYFDDLRVEPAR